MGRALVYGTAIAGLATARALQRRGFELVLVDDRPDAAGRSAATALGAELVVAPGLERLRELVAGCEIVSPSPGVPEGHPVFAACAANGIDPRSEIDLAWEWELARPGGPRPMVAVTGTDGKTTTTLLAVAMVEAAGSRAVACGNTEVPLVDAIDTDAEVLVVEATSFRLATTCCFSPRVATWLNLAPDHLDWHTDLSSYAAAKARIWAFQGRDDVALGFADDPVVMAHLAAAPARRLTFAASGADYHRAGGTLVGPGGPIAEVASMRRRLPHDVTNALAAAATVLEAGVARRDAVAAALATFTGPHHRIELVLEQDGVAWFDDSKATTPHACLTAVRAFDSVVLIAGGRNKDLDLTVLRDAATHVRAVVAIGEAADEVGAAFDGVRPVVRADSMADAVRAAAELARPGDAVLLSPACASFDWYRGYGARGDDFAAKVRAHLGAVG
jgi:UDP-N-acetylmuramoylalanine--D-glutamate ligase